MDQVQQFTILVFALLNFFVLLKGLNELTAKDHSLKVTVPLFPLGIFVWGDALVISMFWILASVVSLIAQNWNLFLLIISVFWVIRSLGETIYWIHEQFAVTKRNNPKGLFGYFIFQNSSVVLIYQLFWQCMTVASLICSIYFAFQWVQDLM